MIPMKANEPANIPHHTLPVLLVTNSPTRNEKIKMVKRLAISPINL